MSKLCTPFSLLSLFSIVWPAAAADQYARPQALAAAPAAASQSPTPPAALNFTMAALSGGEVDLRQYAGKVVLIVNVASKCGLTPQYQQLQALQEKYGKEGLVVLGFPCNQFKGQEPGSAEEIRAFCTAKFGVTFPLLAKVEVNGDGACPLYKHLTALDVKPAGAGKISWNFEKFLLDRNGQVVARWSPRTKPDASEVIKRIEEELAKKQASARRMEKGAALARNKVGS